MVVLFITTMLFSCKEEVSDINPEGDARYSFTFEGTWMSPQHTVPGNAHFTTFIGMTHNKLIKLFDIGAMATPGVELVAEQGKTETASDEIDVHISNGNAFSKPVISVGDGPAGVATGSFTVDEDFPVFSIISMIAPSPDWFVGIHDLELFVDGDWIADTSFAIVSYDAGTEDGDVLSGDNDPTDPQGTIEYLTPINASSLTNGNPLLAPLGTVRITRIE